MRFNLKKMTLLAAGTILADGSAHSQVAIYKLQPLVGTSARRIAIAEQVALAKWDNGIPVEDASYARSYTATSTPSDLLFPFPTFRTQQKMISLGKLEVMMASTEDVIVKDPEILGGIPVFRGTRVPFKNLLDYLEGGHTLGEFLEEFPSVTREDAIAALEYAKNLVIAQTR